MSNPGGTGLPLSSSQRPGLVERKVLLQRRQRLRRCRPLRFADPWPRRKPRWRNTGLRRRQPRLRLISACAFDLDIRRRRPLLHEFPSARRMRRAAAPLTAELAFFVAKIARRPLNCARREPKIIGCEAQGPHNGERRQCWGASRHIAQHRGCDHVKLRSFTVLPFHRRLRSSASRCSTGSPAASQNAPTYPPYNIERTGENAYRITLAVAGFAENELSVETRESTLTVRGSKEAAAEGREARHALSGHRRARLRAPLPACRPRRRDGRGKRERSAAHRSGAGGSRGAEAAHHRDQQGRARPSKPSRRRPRRRRNRASAERSTKSGRPSRDALFLSIRTAPAGTMLTFGLSLASADEPGAAGWLGARRGAVDLSRADVDSSARRSSVSRPAWARTSPIRPASPLRAGREAAEAGLTIGVAALLGRILRPVAADFALGFVPAGASAAPIRADGARNANVRRIRRSAIRRIGRRRAAGSTPGGSRSDAVSRGRRIRPSRARAGPTASTGGARSAQGSARSWRR